jgi:hypothetical protein
MCFLEGRKKFGGVGFEWNLPVHGLMLDENRNTLTIKKGTEALLEADKQVNLGGGVEKTKRMFMSRHQNAGHSI